MGRIKLFRYLLTYLLPVTKFVEFLRATACYSAYMPWQFRLSVRPSVTQVDQSKAFEVRIMQFSPYSSPIPLVSAG